MSLTIELKGYINNNPYKALVDALKIAVALDKTQTVYFKDLGEHGTSIRVYPQSYIQDITQIYDLHLKLNPIKLDEL